MNSKLLSTPRISFTSYSRIERADGTVVHDIPSANHSGCLLPDDEYVKNTIKGYYQQKASMETGSMHYERYGEKFFVTRIVILDGHDLIEKNKHVLNSQ